MMRDGACWERTALAHHTSGIESGSEQNWPTPRAGKTTDENEESWQKRKDKGNVSTPPLSLAVKMWPTPNKSDSKGANLTNGHDIGRNYLRAEVIFRGKTWPTPQANEDAAGTPKGNMQKMLGNDKRIRGENESDWNKGALSPDWVEWLMGWPIGHTSLDPITLDWRTWEQDPADTGEIPRIGTGIPNRAARLKAIGNGQVPQCAALAWTTLAER